MAAANRRRTVLSAAGILIVVALLCAVLFESQAAVRIERHTSLGKRAGDFYALFGVMRELGYRSDRHFRSYGQLPPPESTALFCLAPIPAETWKAAQLGHLDQGQVDALAGWVRSGGRLLASLPGRQVVRVFGADVAAGSGRAELDAERDPVAAIWPAELPPTRAVRAAGVLRLESEPRRLSRPMEALPNALELAPAFFEPALVGGNPTMAVFEADVVSAPDAVVRPELWLGDRLVVVSAPVGAGRVYLAASALPFTNLGLARLGTAAAAVSILDDVTERGRRSVLFDEFIHGLSPRRGIGWWAWNSALRYPLLAVLAWVLVLGWRGAVRLGAPRPVLVTPRRAVEEYVVSLADLSRRARRHRGAARRILSAYRSRLFVARGGVARGGVAESGLATADPFTPLAEELRGAAEFGHQELLAFDRRARRVYHQARNQTSDPDPS